MFRQMIEGIHQSARKAICKHEVEKVVHVLCESLPYSRREHADALEDRGF